MRGEIGEKRNGNQCNMAACDTSACCDRGGPAQLFVIRQLNRPLYWNCSSEHGCGWNPGNPKQSFSKSELTRELTRMIENGHFCNVEIVQLELSA